jgi:hypothetical protein
VQQFILTVKGKDGKTITVGRRYGEFVRLQRNLRTELPGKMFPSVPKKNKSSTSHSGLLSIGGDDSSLSSVSTQDTMPMHDESNSLRTLVDRRRSRSRNPSPMDSTEDFQKPIILWRETQRVGLRAFIRTLLQNSQIAQTKAMNLFLTSSPIKLNEEEMGDLKRRKEMDELRVEEQRRFYEIARQRAQELDIYMERFRRDIVESSRLWSEFTCLKRGANSQNNRRPHETIPGNPREREARRSECTVPEICRMAKDRVCNNLPRGL